MPFTLLVGRFGSFSADGSQLSTIVRLRHEDYSVHVWSAETFEEKAILEHSDFVDAAKLSPDGTRVATVGKDGKIRLWNPATSSLELELPGAAVAFSPDGTLLAVGSCED